MNVLKEILFNIPRVSFYGFLMAIAKSERINEHIGRNKDYTVTLQLWTPLHSFTGRNGKLVYSNFDTYYLISITGIITGYMKQARQ